ncbi:MAG: GTPase Era [Synergistaceae bacterium]|jgi:GTP-binding protein Era|nr:GTPase Era [Synergistaceae bacterium]
MSDKKICRAGFVALVGAPNVGKSSIVNALLAEHVAAVSSKPQTTRNAVRCVLTAGECQLVIVDTPGAHKPKFALGEFMTREIESAFESADVVCLVLEAGRPLDENCEMICERVGHAKAPVVLAANKIDKLRGGEDFWRWLEPVQERIKPAAVVPVSALEGTNLDVLRDELAKRVPEGGAIYPEDVLMDTTERFLAEEIIREQIFKSTEQEVPHSVAVTVEEFKSPDEYPELKRAEIRADIIVERPGQKGILIGEGGSKMKSIKSGARAEMERRFGYPISLSLWVKVKPQWRKSAEGIQRAGYRN